MERLNSRLQKLKSKKGFTLIELLAVIAIIAILVLIAAPSFLGNKEKAVLAAVKADIKTAELAVGRHLLEHETLAKQTVNGKEIGFDKYNPEPGKDYYNVNGKLDTPVGGDLYDVSKIIDSKVLEKGTLVASDNGKVYFVTDEGKLKTPGKGNSSTGGDNSGGDTGNGSGTGTGGDTGNGSGNNEGSNPGSGGEKEPEVKPTPNPKEDFEWNTTYGVEAYAGYEFPGQSGKGFWKYVGKSTEVVIPEEINGNPLTNYMGMFRKGSTPVTKVTSTSQQVTNMNAMFYNSQATSLDLSGLDTSSVKDMRNMFEGSKAETITFGNKFDTSKVATMSYMFSDSQAISLDLSSFDTSKVTDMKSMFKGSKATSLDLSGLDTSIVENMESMFDNSQATSLDLSSFDTSNVTDMRYMFYNSQATSLDLSSFDTSKVTNMQYMFASSQAKSLDLRSFDASKVTTMLNMFNRSKAETITFGNKFDTSKVTTMESMFNGSQAKSLDLSSFDTSNVISMNNMFNGSQATIGYARTQKDADKFNSSSRKPASLKFTVR